MPSRPFARHGLALAAALTVASFVTSALAGTVTSVGAVKPLTAASQVFGVIGSGGFDEGPTSGGVPLGVYSASGLTFRTGALSSMLPGVTTLGSAVQPHYSTPGTHFPSPIAGGGTQSGQANFFAGVATFSVRITQVGLTAGRNGTQYLTVWDTSGKMLGQVTWAPASDSSFVGIDSLGVPIGMVAYGNDNLWSGAAYDSSGATIMSDSWIWARGMCAANADCNDGNACTNDVCNTVTGACSYVNNTAACSDGDACTTNDRCAAGKCTGGTAVVCAAPSACKTTNACNPITGCTYSNKADGVACDDGNACTTGDSCKSGACTSTGVVTCSAKDGCHEAGACNPTTGKCSEPAKPNGTACSDANACTKTDTCVAGVCTGTSPVVCAPIDQCHTAGTCDMATGMCSAPAKPDGSPCDDGNGCTKSDTCVAGACTGASPVVCTASDACHNPGMCDPTTGTCTNPAKSDGSVCDDGDACTRIDTCLAGACKGTSPVTCAASDACHDPGTCDLKTGVCTDPAKSDGAACDDGNECTTDGCRMGTCSGTPKPDGTLCSLGACKEGSCQAVPDAGPTDAGPTDADPTDAGATADGSTSSDVGDSDASGGGAGATADGGCGCRAATGSTSRFGWLAVLGFALLARRRR